MSSCLQGLLQIAHICILLRIDPRVREQDGEIACNNVNIEVVWTDIGENSLDEELHIGGGRRMQIRPGNVTDGSTW